MPGKRARPVRVGGRRKRDLHTQAPRRRPTDTLWDAGFGPAFIKIFYTKVHDRVLAPLFAAGQPRPHRSCALP
jgi:hypothetical protein